MHSGGTGDHHILYQIESLAHNEGDEVSIVVLVDNSKIVDHCAQDAVSNGLVGEDEGGPGLGGSDSFNETALKRLPEPRGQMKHSCNTNTS